MKFSTNRCHGNVLLTILLTTGTLGMALTSYLTLTSSQSRSTMRSQYWNMAIPVAEAGIEEALTQLYHSEGTNFTDNGWTHVGGGYRKTRTMGQNSYTTEISADLNPVITSVGSVLNPASGTYLQRAVRVETRRDSMFMMGMVAKGQIDLLGNNIQTDSFDSGDPAHSTGGRYDVAKRKDNGHVATNSGLTNSLSVGNADIYGRVATGPGGSVSVGPNGGVGNLAWHGAGNHGIQPGYATDDMNVTFPDVQPPFSGGAFTPNSGSIGGTNYTYVLSGGNYQMSSLSMSGQQKMAVTGDSVLYVTGNASMSGQAQIIIGPTANLKLYVGGATASLGGNGIVNNSYGNSTNFFYYGLPSNTSLSFSGNAAFTGVIYAPGADFTLGGGGSTPYDFVGASVTKTVRMNGHFKFHYDEALGRIGPYRGYIVTGWNEVNASGAL
jgi:hypothetical protein